MPRCGPQVPGTLNSDTTNVFSVASEIFTISSTASGVVAAVGKLSLPVGAFPVVVQASCLFIAAAAAVATILIISVIVSDRCSPVTGIQDCFTGVVNGITPAFSSAADQIFPFAAMHDRVDVVIRQKYWTELRTYSKFVKCTHLLDKPPTFASPILMSFYHNNQVCNAGAGAIPGAIIGGIVGAILGAAAATAGIGCATVILCFFALIVAAIIAIIGAIVGAVVGGQIGKAATAPSSPSGTGSAGQVPIQVADYVTVQGNLITAPFLEGEAIFWWVVNTTLYGRSQGKPEFDYRDPDSFFAALSDVCDMENPPIG